MTIERMEAYCIENSDLIYVNSTLYRVIDVGACDEGYVFTLVDEEGERASMTVEGIKKIPVVIDNLATI